MKSCDNHCQEMISCVKHWKEMISCIKHWKQQCILAASQLNQDYKQYHNTVSQL